MLSALSRPSRLSPAKPLWTPALAGVNLAAWWDASALQTLTFNSGNISAWASIAGGFSVTQAASANQPSYSETARNNRPGLTFGGNHWLDTTAVTGFPTGSVPVTVTTVGFNSTSFTAKSFEFGTLSGPQMRTLGTRSGNVDTGNNGTDKTTSTSWVNVDRIALALTSGVSNATDIWVDGVLALSSTLAYSTATTFLRIGAYQNPGECWNGTLQEIVVFSSYIPDNQRQKYEGYAAAKWGLQSQLPATHPYRSAAPRATLEDVERFMDEQRHYPMEDWARADALKLYRPRRRLIVPHGSWRQAA